MALPSLSWPSPVERTIVGSLVPKLVRKLEMSQLVWGDFLNWHHMNHLGKQSSRGPKSNMCQSWNWGWVQLEPVIEMCRRSTQAHEQHGNAEVAAWLILVYCQFSLFVGHNCQYLFIVYLIWEHINGRLLRDIQVAVGFSQIGPGGGARRTPSVATCPALSAAAERWLWQFVQDLLQQTYSKMIICLVLWTCFFLFSKL